MSKDELKDQRNDFEDVCLSRLAAVVPAETRVTILADRGFGGSKLFGFLDELKFGYVIRFRGNIHVTAADGEKRAASGWVGRGGRARRLCDARVTAAGHRVAAVVCVRAKGMKEAWCPAVSNVETGTREAINHYAKRWTIELLFRWMKQHLRLDKFLSNNVNAIKLQLIAAMIAYALLRIVAQANCVKLPILRFFDLVMQCLFDRRDIAAIDQPPSVHPSKKRNNTSPDQLVLR